jgi:ankyrin repeat protein
MFQFDNTEDGTVESPALLSLKVGNFRIARELLSIQTTGNRIQEFQQAVTAGQWNVLNLDGVCTQTVDKLMMDMCSLPKFYWDMACVHDTAAGIDYLLESGGNLQYVDEEDTTLLVAALKAGNTEIAEYILNKLTFSEGEVTKIPDFLNRTNYDGENAISESIKRGIENVVDRLLCLNVDMKWRIEGHLFSALQMACQTSSYLDTSKTVEKLLDRSFTDLDIQDARGNTVMHYLAFGIHGSHTKAAMDGVLKYNGLLLNKTNKEGQTPLQFAISGGCFANVRYLLDKGAEVSIQDKRGYTALHLATDDYGESNYSIFSTLLDHCQRDALNLQDVWGRTPLMYAVGKLPPKDPNHRTQDVNGNEYGKTVKLLLKKGALVDIRDNYGQTVFHHYYGQQAESQFIGHSKGITVQT